MSAYPMKCRFDAGHGDFANGIMLRRHYDEVHAHEYVPTDTKKAGKRQIMCGSCDAVMARSSITDHFKRKHPSQAENYVEMRDVRIKRSPGRPTTASIVAAAQAKAQAPPPPEAPQLMPDDIVMPVVEMLAEPQGLVPVSALPALFVWRDATVAMLRSVQRTK